MPFVVSLRRGMCVQQSDRRSCIRCLHVCKYQLRVREYQLRVRKRLANT